MAYGAKAPAGFGLEVSYGLQRVRTASGTAAGLQGPCHSGSELGSEFEVCSATGPSFAGDPAAALGSIIRRYSDKLLFFVYVMHRVWLCFELCRMSKNEKARAALG